jgi:hypothetical protein
MSAGIGRSKRFQDPTRVVKPASDDLKNNPGSQGMGAITRVTWQP